MANPPWTYECHSDEWHDLSGFQRDRTSIQGVFEESSSRRITPPLPSGLTWPTCPWKPDKVGQPINYLLVTEYNILMHIAGIEFWNFNDVEAVLSEMRLYFNVCRIGVCYFWHALIDRYPAWSGYSRCCHTPFQPRYEVFIVTELYKLCIYGGSLSNLTWITISQIFPSPRKDTPRAWRTFGSPWPLLFHRLRVLM